MLPPEAPADPEERLTVPEEGPPDTELEDLRTPEELEAEDAEDRLGAEDAEEDLEAEDEEEDLEAEEVDLEVVELF